MKASEVLAGRPVRITAGALQGRHGYIGSLGGYDMDMHPEGLPIQVISAALPAGHVFFVTIHRDYLEPDEA